MSVKIERTPLVRKFEETMAKKFHRKTIENYSVWIRRFEEWCAKHKRPLSLHNATTRGWFLMTLKKRRVSKDCYKQAAYALQHFTNSYVKPVSDKDSESKTTICRPKQVPAPESLHERWLKAFMQSANDTASKNQVCGLLRIAAEALLAGDQEKARHALEFHKTVANESSNVIPF